LLLLLLLWVGQGVLLAVSPVCPQLGILQNPLQQMTAAASNI
jgi:hypothetical protein